MLLLILRVGIVRYLRHFFHSRRQSRGVPYVGSFGHHMKLLLGYPDLIPDGAVVYDLGCGDGKALRFFADHRSIGQGKGWDINSFAICYGHWLQRLTRRTRITLTCDNFLTTSAIERLQADVIYCYLFPHIMEEVT
jgi:SAM-dependent methyltransferase